MKYLLIVLLMSFAVGEGLAQKFGFGAETGLTAGRFSDNQFRRRFTYHFGAHTQTALTPNIHMNLGLGYVRKGATTNTDGNILNSGTNFNLDYLELALLAGFGTENFQLRIGPTYSFLIQASFDNVVVTDLINDRELGVKAGLFFKFLEKESAYFSISYYQGLQDTNFDPQERLTTNYFQLSLGYLLLANR